MKRYKETDISFDLRTRTPGEKLWLTRRAAGKTSYEAAALAGVGRNVYREAERDERTPATPFKTGFRTIPRPSLALLLALARRRSGLGLAGTASRTKTTPPTLLARDRAGDPLLVLFWKLRGFRFPHPLPD